MLNSHLQKGLRPYNEVRYTIIYKIGLRVVGNRGLVGCWLDARAQNLALPKFICGILRVTNAGCNEDIVAEPAQF